jgi:hypothetical protein
VLARDHFRDPRNLTGRCQATRKNAAFQAHQNGAIRPALRARIVKAYTSLTMLDASIHGADLPAFDRTDSP